MAFKLLGLSLVNLGVLIIAAQIAAGVMIFAFPSCVSTGLILDGASFLKFDYPDRLCAGLWGGFVIILAGIMAILTRPGFKFMAALSLLCGGAIAGLYVWGLVKIWDYPTHEVPIAQCRDIIQLTFVVRTVIALLGVQVVAANMAVLLKRVKRKRSKTYSPQYASAPMLSQHSTSSSHFADGTLSRSQPVIYAPMSTKNSTEYLDGRTLGRNSTKHSTDHLNGTLERGVHSLV